MSKRVLVVDDSVFMRDIIKDIFAAGGFSVVGEAGNGVEAVEKYKELKPDLVTMDLVMPYRNGIDATREILGASFEDAALEFVDLVHEGEVELTDCESGERRRFHIDLD